MNNNYIKIIIIIIIILQYFGNYHIPKNLPGALINSTFSDCTVLTSCCTICFSDEFDNSNDEEDCDGGEVELNEKEGVGVYSSASVKSFKI